MRSPALKRGLDIIVSLTALFVLSGPLLALSLLVRIFLGSPVFFRQKRPGRNGELFLLIKFRTMKDIRNERNELVEDALRLTSFGKVLRACSLDELPELWNVLRGDMSLVGPRPLLPQYLSRYTGEQARRHEMRPGITGWAQVNGRNALEWADRFKLDVWYVDNWTFQLDIKILFLTMAKVLGRHGISAPGSETMPEFRGEI